MPARAINTDNHYEEALRLFATQPVNPGMIAYLAQIASGVVTHVLPISSTASDQQQDVPSILPELSRHGARYDGEAALPTIEEFITHLTNTSKVGVMPLMATLVYMTRLKSRLEPTAHGLPSTPHRIFLASLILAVKFLDDCRLKTKRWVKCSRLQKDGALVEFNRNDVNEMEKQFILLLDWDLAMSGRDLCVALEPFMEPVRQQMA